MLVFAGAALAAIGALGVVGCTAGRPAATAGTFAGDIAYQGKTRLVLFPHCDVYSAGVVLTLVLWLVQWLRNEAIWN